MDAREYVLNDTAFRDLQELETYCDKSVSPILYLGFEALGIRLTGASKMVFYRCNCMFFFTYLL